MNYIRQIYETDLFLPFLTFGSAGYLSVYLFLRYIYTNLKRV